MGPAMSDGHRPILSKKLTLPEMVWREVLLNPLWYVVVIAGLAGLAVYVPVLRWLAGAIALGWGGWLIWQLFAPEQKKAPAEDPLQAYLDQAQIYKAQLHQLLQATSNRHNGRSRERLASQVNTWTEAITGLIQRITLLRRDDLFLRDLAAAPQALQLLETRLNQETEPVLRAQLERALDNRQKQVASLVRLEQIHAQAELQIEDTLSQLGTLYSQLLTHQSTHHIVDYDCLSADLEEAVGRLQDQLAALGEVKGMYQTEL